MEYHFLLFSGNLFTVLADNDNLGVSFPLHGHVHHDVGELGPRPCAVGCGSCVVSKPVNLFVVKLPLLFLKLVMNVPVFTVRTFVIGNLPI